MTEAVTVNSLIFKESDGFPAILKTIVDLENGDAAIPSETQSQGSSQDPSNCREGLRRLGGERLKVFYIATL